MWKKALAISFFLGTTHAYAGVIYQDDFNDGVVSGLNFVGNAWTEQQGRLVSGGGFSLALFDGITVPGTFTLEADVMTVNGSDWGHVGFAWGYDGSNFNTTYLRTHSDHVTSHTRNDFLGGERILATPGTLGATSLTSGPTYHLSVNVNSTIGSMTVALDGYSETYTGIDFDHLNSKTGPSLGLITWDHVAVDNVMLSTPVPLPASAWLFGTGLLLLLGGRRSAGRTWRRPV